MERPGTPLLGWARTPGLTDGQFVRNRAGGWGTICDHPGYVQSIRTRYGRALVPEGLGSGGLPASIDYELFLVLRAYLLLTYDDLASSSMGCA